jgi:hypothetical protein
MRIKSASRAFEHRNRQHETDHFLAVKSREGKAAAYFVTIKWRTGEFSKSGVAKTERCKSTQPCNSSTVSASRISIFLSVIFQHFFD